MSPGPAELDPRALDSAFPRLPEVNRSYLAEFFPGKYDPNCLVGKYYPVEANMASTDPWTDATASSPGEVQSCQEKIEAITQLISSWFVDMQVPGVDQATHTERLERNRRSWIERNFIAPHYICHNWRTSIQKVMNLLPKTPLQPPSEQLSAELVDALVASITLTWRYVRHRPDTRGSGLLDYCAQEMFSRVRLSKRRKNVGDRRGCYIQNWTHDDFLRKKFVRAQICTVSEATARTLDGWIGENMNPDGTGDIIECTSMYLWAQENYAGIVELLQHLAPSELLGMKWNNRQVYYCGDWSNLVDRTVGEPWMYQLESTEATPEVLQRCSDIVNAAKEAAWEGLQDIYRAAAAFDELEEKIYERYQLICDWKGLDINQFKKRRLPDPKDWSDEQRTLLCGAGTRLQHGILRLRHQHRGHLQRPLHPIPNHTMCVTSNHAYGGGTTVALPRVRMAAGATEEAQEVLGKVEERQHGARGTCHPRIHGTIMKMTQQRLSPETMDHTPEEIGLLDGTWPLAHLPRWLSRPLMHQRL